jgi:hypothetical protein
MGQMEFINLSHPSDRSSASLQRRANSHAAREAHARARRLRAANYQAHNARKHGQDNQGQSMSRSKGPPDSGQGLGLLIEYGLNEETSVTPTPMSLLPADRRDPFGSFVKPFTPREHFLLDHCESNYAPMQDSILWLPSSTIRR